MSLITPIFLSGLLSIGSIPERSVEYDSSIAEENIQTVEVRGIIASIDQKNHKFVLDRLLGPIIITANQNFEMIKQLQEGMDVTVLLNRITKSIPPQGDAIEIVINYTVKTEYVELPTSAKTWRTYKLNVQPIKKNSDWSITPRAFGGLEYEILDKPFPDVVTIDTSRGKRNIYVANGTGEKIVKK